MDSKEYYEKFDWEYAQLDKKIMDKIDLIINSIPKEVKSIADIGCGDGTISNELNKHFNVIALDRSFNALKYVNADKAEASADQLPIKSNSVDLIFSSEMIEHLPEEIFSHAISEMKRICKKYIFLTFPNNENIEKQLVQCPKCNYNFNKSYHLRKLNSDIVKKIFFDYKIIIQFEYGLKVRDYHRVLSNLKHKISPPSAWIPSFWTPNRKRNTMCPNCDNEFEIPYRFNILAYSIDIFNIIISKKKPYQLCILLEKV